MMAYALFISLRTRRRCSFLKHRHVQISLQSRQKRTHLMSSPRAALLTECRSARSSSSKWIDSSTLPSSSRACPPRSRSPLVTYTRAFRTSNTYVEPRSPPTSPATATTRATTRARARPGPRLISADNAASAPDASREPRVAHKAYLRAISRSRRRHREARHAQDRLHAGKRKDTVCDASRIQEGKDEGENSAPTRRPAVPLVIS